MNGWPPAGRDVLQFRNPDTGELEPMISRACMGVDGFTHEECPGELMRGSACGCRCHFDWAQRKGRIWERIEERIEEGS